MALDICRGRDGGEIKMSKRIPSIYLVKHYTVLLAQLI